MSPHVLAASFLLHAGILAAKASTTKSSSSSLSFVIIIVLFAGAYFLLIRPQRQRARRTQQNQQAVQIGEQVMLTSGIIGRVTWLEGDRARIEIAPNTEVEVLRAAIGRTIPAPVSDEAIAPQEGEDESHFRDNPYVEPGENGTAEETAVTSSGTDGTELATSAGTPAPATAGQEAGSVIGEDEEGR